jgi:histone-lysine N-methyltransferase SETMAR
MTKAAIKELDWEILPQPPYSPDLAPSDCHLFRSLCYNLRGVSFNNDAELQNRLDFFTVKPVDFFKRGIAEPAQTLGGSRNNGREYIID